MKIFSLFLGKCLCVLQLLAGIALMYEIVMLQLLPTVYLLAIAAVVICLIGLSAFLSWSGKGKAKMVIGVFLSVIVILSSTLGVSMLRKTRNTYESISAGTEIVHMGIYVRSDDTSDYATEAKNYCYGFIENMDRESIDSVIHQMTDFFGNPPTLKPYPSLPDLIDALLAGEVDAIILNQAYLDILTELKGYEAVLDRICEIELKRVEIKNEPIIQDKDEPSPDTDETFGIYISGIDTKGPVSVRSRSDVNILAFVNPKTRQVLLISTPRDYFVPLSISDGIPDKLTHAGVYGINVSKDTLGMLYDVEIDYYFRINFSGFVTLIDALGGITVNSDSSFNADKGRYSFSEGENYLDGRAALAFCRERYALSGGDRARGKHQMAVIQGVAKKVLSPALLQNYSAVLDSVEGCFETTIPLKLIGKLVSRQLKDGGAWNFVIYSVDGTGDYQVPYSMSMNAYVMQPDYATIDCAKAMIEKLYNGEILEN